MQVATTATTTTIRRALGAIAISGALALAAGCHSNSANSQTSSGPDPAAANMAPANGQTQVLGQNASYSPQQQGEAYPQQPGQYPQQAPAPVDQNYPQQGYAQQPGYPDQELAGEEALDESTQPPPALPDYDQPPAPGPDYMWTPGYWAWGQEGYYWVPGAWVEPPYYGALWTPPYWGWYGGRYRFHHGYWGRHVGYYGGIDYGFGYIGIGYFGGYWNNNHFYYNTAVTRVGPGVRTIYQRPVVYNNVRYGVQPGNRVSYNGGRGGINVQPRATEVAAMHERHEAPMAAQQQVRTEASQNRSQFYNENHGRPAMASAQHGFANSRGIAAAPRVAEPAGPAGARNGQPSGAYMNERGANGARTQPNNEAPRVENRAMQPQPNGAAPRYENRGQPQPNAGNPRVENRGQPQPQPNAGNARFDNRAQPQPNAARPGFENRAQPQPQPRVENRAQPQPQPRVENRPQPQPQPRMENRPQPQPQQRIQNRPQPQPQARMENRPQPQQQNRPAPQARPQGPPPQAHAAPQPQQHGNPGGGHGDEHGHP